MKTFAKFLIFIFIISSFISCEKKEKLSNREIKTVEVKVAAVKTKPIPIFYSVDGFASSEKVAFISPKINGYIEKFYVKTGDKVKKGELLFKIKNREIQEKVKSLKFKLNALKLQQKEVKILISINKKSVVQAEANYKLAKKNYQRFKNLLKSESITPQEFDKMETEFVNAKMELKKAKDLLKVNRLKLKQIKNQINSLKSALKEVEVIANYRLVKSPFNGVVLEKYLDEGNLVNPGVKVLKLGSLKKVAYFSIPLRFKKYVSQHKFIDINWFKANIIEISPDVKRSTSQFTVKTLLPKDKSFENGEYIRGKIFGGSRKAIVIPAKFIRKFNDLYYTYVCKQGFVVKTFLTGFYENNNFIVKSGISEGEKLIVNPIKDFEQNLKCRIKNAS